MNKTTLNSQKEKHSMLSLRRATSLGLLSLKPHTHFYPRSPCGERPGQNPAAYKPDCNFYPRSPCGERRWSLNQSLTSGLFLSTLSLRRATFLPLHTRQRTQISIHALLAESDKIRQTPQRPAHHFYPRSPCGERLRRCTMPTWPLLFLSTLSLRRATRVLLAVLDDQHDFYPRSPCGERPEGSFSPLSPQVFLSTLSLRRATGQICRSTSKQSRFLSTLSLRRATTRHDAQGRTWRISIHALLAESDRGNLPQHRLQHYFYPRSPCGERQVNAEAGLAVVVFLSTLSLRRAT